MAVKGLSCILESNSFRWERLAVGRENKDKRGEWRIVLERSEPLFCCTFFCHSRGLGTPALYSRCLLGCFVPHTNLTPYVTSISRCCSVVTWAGVSESWT